MQVECDCPVCDQSFTVEIEDPDAGSQMYDCECGASLNISYTVSVEVDDVELSGGVSADFECPACGGSESLEITEESGDDETECGCGVSLSVSWSSWGRETRVEVTNATLEYECSECGGSASLDIFEESGEEELDCDSCEARLSVSWSKWGQHVKVQTLETSEDGDDEDDEEEDEDDRDEDDEQEEEDDEDEECF